MSAHRKIVILCYGSTEDSAAVIEAKQYDGGGHSPKNRHRQCCRCRPGMTNGQDLGA